MSWPFACAAFSTAKPIARSPDLVARQETGGRTEPPPLRILVVDDNVDSADVLLLPLKDDGYDVRAAYDGQSALEVARTFAPDVTLQDLGMPGMNGYEFARQLRALPQTRNATLIALTGFSRKEDVVESHAAGFDHHLVKPVDYDTLISLLRSL